MYKYTVHVYFFLRYKQGNRLKIEKLLFSLYSHRRQVHFSVGRANFKI